jgi:hypothetical protein
MTTTTVSGLRDGLAANLNTLFASRAYDTIPDSPNPPCAIVVPTGIEYHAAFANAQSRYAFTILVIVGRVDERTAQDRLDGYCNPSGSGSVKAALESDCTLNGYAFDLSVTEMRNYQQLVLSDGVTYLTAEFVVSVIAE